MKGSYLKPGLALLIAAALFTAPVLGQYLYLLENDCSSDKWVYSYPGCIFNGTLGAWQLNETASGPPAYFNFTSGWEEDAGADIDKQGLNVTWTTWDRTDEGRINRDAADLFSSFTSYNLSFTLKVSFVQNNNPGSVTLLRALLIGEGPYPDWTHILTGNYESYGLTISSTVNQGTTFKLALVETNNGAAYNDGGGTGNLNVGTEYYCILGRDGTNWELWVFSDSDRTTLIENISMTLQSNYGDLGEFYALLGIDAGSGSRTSSGYIKDIYLGSAGPGYEPEGWVYSEELLVNTTMGPAYVFSSSHTVPAGSSLTVAFSSDNSSWVRETALSSVAGALHESIYLNDLNYSSLYVRYNFTSNGLVTPLVSSFDLAYEIDDPGPGSNGWIYTLLAVPTLLLGYAARHKPI